MTRQILYILTIVFLLGCNTTKEKDIQFFEKYDFNSGDYKLHGLLSHGGTNSFTQNVGDFIISDTATLNKIKRDWRIHLTDNRMPCGYSYLLVLMKGDSCLNHFNINLDCEYLTCDRGWFEFPADLLNEHESIVTKVPRQVASSFHDTLISRHVFDN